MRPFDRVAKRKIITEAKDLSAKLVKLDGMLDISPEKVHYFGGGGSEILAIILQAPLQVLLNILRPQLLEISQYVVNTRLVPHDEVCFRLFEHC